MSTGTSPAARALRVLELVRDRPGITAAQIADALGTSDRAVRRHVATLREAEIPVESTSGPYGGYRLGRGVRLPPLVFTAAEALGLVMTALEGGRAVADPDDVVGSALGKIVRALPEGVGQQAAAVRAHAATTARDGAPRPDAGTASALVDAVAARRRTRIGYRSASGSTWEEDVDPWAVVVRRGCWYLLCRSHRTGAVRAYRVDRVLSVHVGHERADVPADLDPVATLEQHLGDGWAYATRVVFDAPVEDVARLVGPPMGRLESAADGHGCVLVGTTGNPAMYAGEWLAAIPLPFRVEGGAELRAAVADLAGRLTASLDDAVPERASPALGP